MLDCPRYSLTLLLLTLSFFFHILIYNSFVFRFYAQQLTWNVFECILGTELKPFNARAILYCNCKVKCHYVLHFVAIEAASSGSARSGTSMMHREKRCGDINNIARNYLTFNTEKNIKIVYSCDKKVFHTFQKC